VAENDLVPRQKEEEEEELYTIGFDDDEPTAPESPKSPRQIRREEKETRRAEEMAERAEEEARQAEEKAAKEKEKAERVRRRKQAWQSLFSGSFLAGEQMRRLLPYLAGIALVMLFYIANIFHLQRLHRTQQRLESDIREESIRAVDLAAQRAQQTQRSTIVLRLKEKNIPLKEYPDPLKKIDSK
jgi:hypothetical protein